MGEASYNYPTLLCREEVLHHLRFSKPNNDNIDGSAAHLGLCRVGLRKGCMRLL